MSIEKREAELFSAIERGDQKALVEIYGSRARELEESDLNAACFYMVNAYVYALELGGPDAEACYQFLLKYGREQ